MNNPSSKNRKTLRHTGVLLLPFIIAAIAVVVWRWLLYDNGLYFSQEAETPFLYMIMPLVGFIYVIFASLAVSAVLDRYQRLLRSVSRKDMATYLDHHEQQLPGMMRGLVAIPSIILLLLAMFYQYADVYAGVAAVYTVTCVVTLTWLVISELDTVHQRTYFKNMTPTHWRHEAAAADKS